MNKIIFFVNCHVNSGYSSLLNIYLTDFKHSGIEQRKDVRLIFVIVGTPQDYIKIEECVKLTLPGMYNNYEGKNILTSYTTERIEFRIYNNSRYEQIGIETAWKEGQTSEDDELITYTHCRGLGHTRANQPEMKNSREIHSYLCAKHIIREYNQVEQIFKDNKEIKKVGVGQSPGGWMWFNFWTVKASYLKSRTRPLKDSDEEKKRLYNTRHYHEYWLGDGGEENQSGYSILVTPPQGSCVTGQEMLDIVSRNTGRRLHI